MNQRLRSAAFLPLLVAAQLAAQGTVVSPTMFTNFAAPSSNAHPFGTATVTSQTMRYMSIHDEMVGRVGVIRGIALRQNENAQSFAVAMTLEVRISTAAVLGATASTTFDNNHGTDKQTVVATSTPINFAPFPAVVPVAPFLLRVPFANLFVFTGGGGIAWEALVQSRTTPTGFQLDAANGGSVFTIGGVNLGTGCIATGRTTAATSTSTYAAASSTLTLSSANLTASAAGAIVLGLSTTSWGGIPLPFDLPNTTGFPSGTCRVHSDWLVDLPSTSTTAGALTQAIPLVLGPATQGAFLLHYGFTLDPAANGLSIVTSNARLTNFGAGTAITGGCRIYAFNDVNAVTGSKDSTVVVTEFQY